MFLACTGSSSVPLLTGCSSRAAPRSGCLAALGPCPCCLAGPAPALHLRSVGLRRRCSSRAASHSGCLAALGPCPCCLAAPAPALHLRSVACAGAAPRALPLTRAASQVRGLRRRCSSRAASHSGCLSLALPRCAWPLPVLPRAASHSGCLAVLGSCPCCLAGPARPLRRPSPSRAASHSGCLSLALPRCAWPLPVLPRAARCVGPRLCCLAPVVSLAPRHFSSVPPSPARAMCRPVRTVHPLGTLRRTDPGAKRSASSGRCRSALVWILTCRCTLPDSVSKPAG